VRVDDLYRVVDARRADVTWRTWRDGAVVEQGTAPLGLEREHGRLRLDLLARDDAAPLRAELSLGAAALWSRDLPPGLPKRDTFVYQPSDRRRVVPGRELLLLRAFTSEAVSAAQERAAAPLDDAPAAAGPGADAPDAETLVQDLSRLPMTELKGWAFEIGLTFVE
jgi:hypothetical protein